MTASSSVPPHRHSRALRGFTLLEIVITVTIIGILAAAGTIAYKQFVTRAQTSEARSAMWQLAKALQAGSATKNAAVETGTFTQEQWGTLPFSAQLPANLTTFSVSPDSRELSAGFSTGYQCWGLFVSNKVGAPATGQPFCGTSGEPEAPRGVRITPGNGKLTASWLLPDESTPGDRAVAWTVEYATSEAGPWLQPQKVSSPQHSAVITGLDNGTTYWVRVTAETLTELTASIIATGVPSRVPDAPTGLNVTMGDKSATISFTPGDNGGNPVKAWRAEASADGGAWTDLPTVNSDQPSYAATGLTPGSKYRFRVYAINDAGESDPSDITAAQTAVTTPGKVVNLNSSIPANQSWKVTWAAPASDGYSPVTGYEVEMSENGGAWTSVTRANDLALSETVSGLDQYSDYDFRVRAVNAIGAGDFDSVAAGKPNLGPTAVTSLTASALTAGKSLTVTFQAPTSWGPSASSAGYQVAWRATGTSDWNTGTLNGSTSAYLNSASVWSTTRTVTLSSASVPSVTLVNGTSYDIRVQARNSAGLLGVPAYVTMTTANEPQAPVSALTVNSAASNAPLTLNVAWTAVPTASNGGLAVTGYDVQYREAGTSDWYDFYRTGTTATSTLNNTSVIAGGAAYADNPLLVEGTSYEVRVAARNGAGAGAWATASGSTVSAPGAVSITSAGVVLNSTTGVAATNTNGTGTIVVSAPTTGGNTISDYGFQWRVAGSGDTWTAGTDTISTATSLSATGLPWDGTTLEFQARAKNAVGWGPWGATYTATTAMPDVPVAPTISSISPNATLPGVATINITALAGASLNRSSLTAPFLEFQYRTAGSNGAWTDGLTSATTSASLTAKNLPTDGTSLEYRVRAHNAASGGGWGAWSTTTGCVACVKTAQNVPNAPTGLASSASITVNTNAVSLTMTAYTTATNGWMTPTGYEAQISPAGTGVWTDAATITPASGNQVTARFTGLSAATAYDYRMRARNAVDWGAWGTLTKTSPATALPTLSVATGASSGQINVTMSANSSFRFGTFTISYQKRGTGTWSTMTVPYSATATPATLTGLTSGSVYNVKISQTTAWGTSADTAVRTATAK